MNARIAAWATIGLLWGTFFLEFVVPLALALLAMGVGFILCFARHKKLDRIAVIALINISYWLFSGILVGSITPLDVISPAFLNGDGRIIVAYSPLFLFGSVLIKWENLAVLHRTMVYIAIACLLFYVVWLLTGASILSEGLSGNYVAFLTSHTGGGTFFGAIAIFLILFGYVGKHVVTQFLGWAMTMPVIASASREALLAILIVAAWYVFRERRWRVLLGALVMVSSVVGVMPLVSEHTWGRTTSLFNTQIIYDSIQQARIGYEMEPTAAMDPEIVGKQQNIMARILFWGYAFKRFEQSPVFGIGFGRYNDRLLELDGFEGVAYFATGGLKSLDVGNAHNSFIHVLCESGIIGLGLLLTMWIAIYWRLQRALAHYAQWREMRALLMSAQALVVYSMACALPGHALASPSVMLPVLTVVGIALSAHKSFLSISLSEAAVDEMPVEDQSDISSSARA